MDSEVAGRSSVAPPLKERPSVARECLVALRTEGRGRRGRAIACIAGDSARRRSGRRVGVAVPHRRRTARPFPNRAEARRFHSRTAQRARHRREGAHGSERGVAFPERDCRQHRRTGTLVRIEGGSMGDIGSLSTPLWIMAAVSILEALVLIGIAIGGYLVYSRVM